MGAERIERMSAVGGTHAIGIVEILISPRYFLEASVLGAAWRMNTAPQCPRSCVANVRRHDTIDLAVGSSEGA